jgi:hypothetical protein
MIFKVFQKNSKKYLTNCSVYAIIIVQGVAKEFPEATQTATKGVAERYYNNRLFKREED